MFQVTNFELSTRGYRLRTKSFHVVRCWGTYHSAARVRSVWQSLVWTPRATQCFVLAIPPSVCFAARRCLSGCSPFDISSRAQLDVGGSATVPVGVVVMNTATGLVELQVMHRMATGPRHSLPSVCLAHWLHITNINKLIKAWCPFLHICWYWMLDRPSSCFREETGSNLCLDSAFIHHSFIQYSVWRQNSPQIPRHSAI
jgi:hypothetical protein